MQAFDKSIQKGIYMIRNTLTYKYSVCVGIFHFTILATIILYGCYLEYITPGAAQGYGWLILFIYLPISTLLSFLLYLIGAGLLVADYIRMKTPNTAPAPIQKKSIIKIIFEIFFIGVYILQMVPTFYILLLFFAGFLKNILAG